MKETLVCLGRFGDIVNVLPIAKLKADLSGETVNWVVSEEFASILDGCSYVKPYPVNIPYDRLHEGMKMAKRICQGTSIVRAQAWGSDISVPKLAFSFCTDTWNWFGIPYGSLPVVFDRRRHDKEQELITKYFVQGKKNVLLNTNGISGAFRHGSELRDLLRDRLPDVNLVDISFLRADRIYDILGLFEQANCLVTIDSSPLHLAAAVPSLPVITLIPDHEHRWCVAPYRKNHIKRISHAEYRTRIDEVVAAINNPQTPRIIHAWSDFRPYPENDMSKDAARVRMARSTWKAEANNANWIDAEFKECDAFRTSDKTIGDNRNMPYIRDILDNAASKADADNDIICITNSDICFVPGLSGWIIENVQRHGSCWAQRWDSFTQIKKPCISEYECGKLTWYDGADLFSFTVQWWKEHRMEYPDMLIGCESWDAAMRQLIKKYHGVELHKAIYHERHDSFWYRTGNREHNPGNVYNRDLNRKWLKANPQFPWMDMKAPIK